MTILKKLILVRHGESEHLKGDITGGWTDSRLTPLGVQQANATGQKLASNGIDKGTSLFSSDLHRARATATAIASYTGQTVEYHRELRELGNGVAADMTCEEARSISLPMTEPAIDWIPYPEAESWRMMSERVMTFLDSVATDCKSETILVVSHGNALVAAVHWWLQLPDTYWSRISYDFDCASITQLSINEWGERSIHSLNETSHCLR